eukprot:6374369-Lingulodinium_polyedra.AAC.1
MGHTETARVDACAYAANAHVHARGMDAHARVMGYIMGPLPARVHKRWQNHITHARKTRDNRRYLVEMARKRP